jgi:hypothetical protein
MKKVIGVTNFPEHCFFNILFPFAYTYKICRVIYVCDAQLLCTRRKNLSRVFYQCEEKMLMGLTNRSVIGVNRKFVDFPIELRGDTRDLRVFRAFRG